MHTLYRDKNMDTINTVKEISKIRTILSKHRLPLLLPDLHSPKTYHHVTDSFSGQKTNSP